jgi:hypothetical protein
MNSLVRRTAAAVFVAGIGLAVVASGATPAAASPQPIGSCTTTSGVILAVDFAHWGGPLLRACGSTPTTGYQLLNQGGWHTTGDSHDGPGFVCRIGYSGFHGGTSYPTPQQDACIVTPPTSAYWSYWHAAPGRNTWTYSQLGAMSYRPQPGSVDLWIFGGTSTPTFGPDSVRAHNTAPGGGATTLPPAAPTRGNQPTAHPGGGGQTLAPPGNGGGEGGGVPGGGRATTPTGAGTTTGTSGATPSGGASGVPPIVDVGPTVPAASHSRTGSATPAIVALVIVVLLGAAGVTVALRRRPRGDA